MFIFIIQRITGFLDHWGKLEKWFQRFGTLKSVDASLEKDALYYETEKILEDTIKHVGYLLNLLLFLFHLRTILITEDNKKNHIKVKYCEEVIYQSIDDLYIMKLPGVCSFLNGSVQILLDYF